MAFTGSPVDSVQRAAQRGATKIDQHDWSRLQVVFFNYVHSAGAGTGAINLVKLPAGKIRGFPSLCRITASAMVATADLHIWHRAYTDPDAATPAVVEDDNEFADNLDAGSAIDAAFLIPVGAPVYNTKDGFEIYAMINTANIEDTDTIDGYFVYARGG